MRARFESDNVPLMSGVQAEYYRKQAEVCRQQAALRSGDRGTVDIWLKLAVEYEKMAQDAETVAQFEQRERIWRQLLQPQPKQEGT